MRTSHGPRRISEADKIALIESGLPNIRWASQLSYPLAMAPPSPVRIRKYRATDAMKRRTNGLPSCSFNSVRSCSVAQKVLCQVPERSYHHLDGTCTPHGMARNSQAPLVPQNCPSVLQHCLVDCSQRSTTSWGKVRRMRHVARVKYGGVLAVAYDEYRRLIVDKTIRKWKSSALR